MQLGLALYDPAYPSEDGSYWTWRHPQLSSQLLSDLFYKVISPLLSENERIRTLPDAELIAGYAKLSGNHLVFRVVDGGRDRQNRPGRYVAICAAPLDSVEEPLPLEAIWRSREFERLAEEARRKCPLPPPATLELTAVASDVAPAAEHIMLQLAQVGLLQWRDSASWSEFTQACCELPLGDWKATIVLRPEEQVAEIRRISNTPTLASKSADRTPGMTSSVNNEPPSRAVSAGSQASPLWKRMGVIGSLLVIFLGLPVVWFLTSRPVESMTRKSSDSNSRPSETTGNSEQPRNTRPPRLAIKRIGRVTTFVDPLVPESGRESLEIQFHLPEEWAQARDHLEGKIEVIAADSNSARVAKEPLSEIRSLREVLQSHEVETSDMISVSFSRWPKQRFLLRITLSSPGDLPTRFESTAYLAP